MSEHSYTPDPDMTAREAIWAAKDEAIQAMWAAAGGIRCAAWASRSRWMRSTPSCRRRCPSARTAPAPLRTSTSSHR